MDARFVLSGGEAGCSGELGDRSLVGVGGGAELGRDGWAVDLGESGAQQPGVGAGEEQRVA